MGTCNCCCRIPFILLSFLFIFSCCFSVISNAADTLSHGQSITDGQTIISNGEDFALGFFSPVNSTNRYVGIWYNKISVQTVVWIANRDNPIMDSSGVFTLGSNGNLMVLDGNGTSIWSSNSSVILNDSCAILMDSGNFILSIKEYVGRTDKAIWQTFDYPTDTYLPGMRVGLNLLDGKSHIFTSWKTDNDPSKGNFTMAADPDGSAQIVMWEGSKRRWRSGLWNGQIFIGVPNMSVLYLYGFKISNDERGQMFFTYTPVNSSVILRFRIRWDGREEQVFWDERRKEWIHYWSQPINDCELYNQCGPFGSCNMLSTPICSCLYGFVPKSINEWNSGNWSSGCVRRTELQCERNITSANEVDGDGFREVEGVKLPDFATWRTTSSTNECADMCLSNCSCKAYAFVSGIGCLTWAQDVVDIQHFGEGGNELYIRLPSSELGKKRKIPIFVIVIAVIIGTIVLSTSAYLIWRYKAKQRDLSRKRKARLTLDFSKSREFWTDLSGTDDVGEGNQGNGPELPLFSFNDIATATNNFSNTNKLGQGGFGPVFKGILPCGMEIAVKRLSRRSGQGSEEFKTEFVLIAKLQHRNLVRLLGCCVQGEERMLVYEYLPNKSLDAFIFDSTKKVELDWGKRFNIIEGIARGLLYLHRDSRLRIIHRDLKASNILLDEEMNPKISDFGMAKIFGGNQNQANTNRVVGTYGYMSPEYAMEGLFSVKSDVYSFGVLLLEIVSGKRNTQRHSEQTSNLLVHAWKLWNEGKAMEFFDSSISDSCSPSDVLRCIRVGLLCVQDNAVDRPTMSSVVLMLGSETASIPTPREPTFTIARTPVEMESSLESSEVITNNNVTVTMIVGR